MQVPANVCRDDAQVFAAGHNSVCPMHKEFAHCAAILGQGGSGGADLDRAHRDRDTVG